MNKKWFKVLSTSFIASSLLGTIGFSAHASTGTQLTSLDVLPTVPNEEMLMSEQSPDLRIPNDIDVTSSKPVDIIVQFNEEPSKIQLAKNKKSNQRTSFNIQKADEKVEENHQDFKALFVNKKSKLTSSVRINHEYKHAFNGVAITIPANQIPELLESGLVKAVAKDKEVHIDPLDKTDASSSTQSRTVSETLPNIGVDKLHEEGVTGEGIKVGVLDTGIDYHHPDLKNVYKGGYDFVDNDDDPMETTYADWKASGKPEVSGNTYYTSHGTHVSGTIAGQNKNELNGVEGVAPNVDLYVYRVLGPYGSGSTNDILAAIDKAVQDGMDVINLSLAADTNDPFDPLSIALNNATIAGTLPVIAAGNAGSDMYTLGSPGAAALPLTVGASNFSITLPKVDGTIHSSSSFSPNLQLFAKNFTDDIQKLEGKNFPVVKAGRGMPSDFVGKDFKDKILVVNYGDYTPDLVLKSAKEAGAAAVFFTNGRNLYTDFYKGESNKFLPTFILPNEDAAKLVDQIAKESITFSFDTVGEMKTNGDELAFFSSRGPTLETFDIKPEITAPGVAVYSAAPSYITNPDNLNDYQTAYQRMSGTSMATPHVAGVAALLLQEHPNYTPADVKTVLMNTADKLSKDYSVYEVGAGRIDAYEAAHTDMEFQVNGETVNIVDGQPVKIPNLTGSLSFGANIIKDEPITKTMPITIKNNSSSKKQFQVEVMYQKDTRNAKDAKANGVKLSVPSLLSVEGDSEQSINADLMVPVSAEYGTYEGYVIFTNQADRNEQYQIPFGVRKMGQGITKLNLTSNTITTNSHSSAKITTDVVTRLLSPTVIDLQLFIKDPKTGKRIGYSGTVLTYGKEENVDGRMQFDGTPMPMSLSEPDLIIQESTTLSSGKYSMEVVGRDTNGNNFSEEVPFYVDNKMPIVKMLKKGGVYEVDKKGMQIAGWIYDEPIENNPNREKSVYMNAPGTLIYQPIPVNKFGLFSTTLSLAEGETYKQAFLLPMDEANNYVYGRPDYNYTIVQKGTQYANIAAKETEIKSDKLFTAQVMLNNVKQMQSGEFTISYPAGLVLKDVKLSKQLSKDYQLSTKYGTNTVTLQVNHDGKKVNLNKNTSLVDMTFAVSNEKYMKGPKEIALKNVNIKESEDSTTKILSFGQYFNILPVTSQISGDLLLSGFSWNKVSDENYSKLNATLIAYDKKGHAYVGVIPRDGRFTLKDLPVQNDVYKVEVKIPGHFRSVLNVEEMNEMYNGKKIGLSKTLNTDFIQAGDVNGDDVVDVLDAIEIKNHYNTIYRNADINFDGTVDAKDMTSVTYYYKRKNPNVADSPEPKLELNGMTLDSILRDLGIKK
ncbi:S8 family serine peptidase (plasmid) [Arthrobacter citreus]|nr:S8 family serine peptidase [Arthrobacter citreus]